MTIHSYPIEVESDFLEKLSKASPVPALAELIWNSVDADAHNVEVTFGTDELGTMTSIVVRDDGHGLSFPDAPTHFRKLGGSWKATGKKTAREDRFLHGKDGNGRFRAFTLGEHVEWDVTYEKDGSRRNFVITMNASSPKSVSISDEAMAETQKPRGVTVRISNLSRDFRSLRSHAGLQELTEIFALYLCDYRAVSIVIDGVKLDPVSAIASRSSVELGDLVDAGTSHPVSLDIIEWHNETTRSLQLCTEDGFPLLPVERRFHVGHFHFSAYLRSHYFTKLQAENTIGLAPMQGPVAEKIEEAYGAIKNYFRSRAAENAKTLVAEWKEENVYPYATEAKSQVEMVERQVFDIVAVNVAAHVPDFEKTAPKTRALHLRLLRQAIEKSPSDLQLILDEVLNLPKKKQAELAELLRDVSLSAVIGAAKIVADRIKFLSGLEAILFDTEKKALLKERSQLHKIIAENCWIFGEQYNLSVSDQSLTEVLMKHREAVGSPIAIDEPVRHISQSRGIIDLMLTKVTRNHQPNTTSHLVVELKAPKVSIGQKEIGQVEGYAFSVAKDERFLGRRVKWEFWVISDQYGDYAENRIQDDSGVVHDKENIRIFVKSWAQVLDENRARLQFFQEKLEFQATKQSAISHLQEHYAKFLEGVILSTEPESSDDQPAA